MKTLKDHIILYDAECPMCKLYTNAFTKTGMLDNNGRASYQQMPEAACPYVDRQRAVNEIALVNTKTGEVNYGIHSVFKVIANSFPVFKPLFSFGPFTWLMSKLYAFISYNRRVIIPTDINQATGIQPTFKLRYRIAYLIFTWAVVGFILTGMLDDGTAGLNSVKTRGGVAVVQDPKDAEASGMPGSALRNVQVDHCLPLAEIPALLIRLAKKQTAVKGKKGAGQMGKRSMSPGNMEKAFGSPTAFVLS